MIEPPGDSLITIIGGREVLDQEEFVLFSGTSFELSNDRL
jgi:hypothetical protein